jgi:hypothetical protein
MLAITLTKRVGEYVLHKKPGYGDKKVYWGKFLLAREWPIVILGQRDQIYIHCSIYFIWRRFMNLFCATSSQR